MTPQQMQAPHHDIIQRADMDMFFVAHAIGTDAQFEAAADRACSELTNEGATYIEISGPMNCPHDFNRILAAWGWR